MSSIDNLVAVVGGWLVLMSVILAGILGAIVLGVGFGMALKACGL